MAWWLAIAALPPLPIRITLLPLAWVLRAVSATHSKPALQVERQPLGVAHTDGGEGTP